MKRLANHENNATSMKALVYQGPGCRAWEDRTKPTIMEATDAIVNSMTSRRFMEEIIVLDWLLR